MFKMNKKMEYALISLKYMSQKSPGQLTSAKEISSSFNIPFDPTARVLQIMTQHELLRAVQGVHGGYQILKDLSKISLGDLNNIIIGPIRITTCSCGENKCKINGHCDMVKSMNKLNLRLQELFDTIKLQDFFELEKPKKHQLAKK